MTGDNCPYLNEYGELVIPFGCNRVYHWWNRGLEIVDTLEELNAPEEIVNKYEGRL